jgi:hypothetical protein
MMTGRIFGRAKSAVGKIAPIKVKERRGSRTNRQAVTVTTNGPIKA